MRRDSNAGWGFFAVFAAYVYFLLFAQFGFLHRAQEGLPDVRPVMAAMGIGGLAASLAAAARLRKRSPIRFGFALCAVSAVLSLWARGTFWFCVIAAAVGVGTALVTVSVASGLRSWMRGPRAGWQTGLATGAAYALCNVPSLFEGRGELQALLPAALCALALAVPLPEPAPVEPISGRAARRSLAGFVLIFFALVALDSAAFATIQHEAALKGATWGAPGQKMLMGAVHFAAAAAAGWLLDRGRIRMVLGSAMALFAVGLPLLWGPLYAAGISFYSVALVSYPSMEDDGVAPRWRAGWVYGFAGWIGSAFGVGLAQSLHRVSFALIAWAAVLVSAGVWLARRRPLALAACLVALAGTAQADSPVERGRRVYIEEGCLHCHSQYVRPGTRDVEWWGPFRPVDRSETPPLIGNRRQGPDLLNVGNRRNPLWQKLHLENPGALSPGSRMPSYAHLFRDGRGEDLVAYLCSLGATTWVARAEQIASWRPSETDADAERGRARFRRDCAACHGADARGDGPVAAQLNDPFVSLRDGPFRFAAGPDRRLALARIVKFGLPGLPMPGHEYYPDAEINDLVAYLEKLDSSHDDAR